VFTGGVVWWYRNLFHYRTAKGMMLGFSCPNYVIHFFST
jgi:hypothetical protein